MPGVLVLVSASPNTHTPLGDLIVKLLFALDSYNATDLTLSTPTTPSETSGERARLCINSALQMMYDLIKDSKYLAAFPTTALSSEDNIDFIQLDEVTQLDDIEAILDTTNNFKLIRKSWQWYRHNFPDPSTSTGTPKWYIRRENRIYLAPRPSGPLTYTIDFRKFTEDLKKNADLPLLPTRYDYWIVAEAKVKWAEMEDPASVPELFISERNDQRVTAMASIFSGYDETSQLGSCINRYLPRTGGFDKL